MKVSHEIPLKYLEFSKQFNDYDYALVHLFPECEEYKEFFKNSIVEGREVLLDNSAYEITTNPELLAKYPSGYFPEELYVQYIREIKPTYYVLPDVKDDCSETIRVVTEWLDKYGQLNKELGLKTIGVVHGKTFDELQHCYHFLSTHCDKIAFSFESWWFDYAKKHNIELSEIRKYVINHLHINTRVPMHLLGCILPNEFSLWNRTPYIESIDTSAPITNAIEGKVLKKIMTEKPKTTIHGSFYMDYKEDTAKLMKKNARLFKKYYLSE